MPEPRTKNVHRSFLLAYYNLSFLKLFLSGHVLWGHTLRTTYATAKGAHGYCGQKWEAQGQPSVIARSQSQQLCSGFSRSQGLAVSTHHAASCQSLLNVAPSLWMPHTLASPGRNPSSPSRCQHFFLPAHYHRHWIAVVWKPKEKDFYVAGACTKHQTCHTTPAVSW